MPKEIKKALSQTETQDRENLDRPQVLPSDGVAELLEKAAFVADQVDGEMFLSRHFHPEEPDVPLWGCSIGRDTETAWDPTPEGALRKIILYGPIPLPEEEEADDPDSA